MSQAAQAQGIHERAVQDTEEARRALLDLQAKVEAGKLSPEEYDAEHERVYDLLKAARAAKKRAAALAELDDNTEDLTRPTPRREPDQPVYRRAATPLRANGEEWVTPEPPPSFAGGHLAMSPEQLGRCAAMAGVAPHEFRVISGTDREAVNRYMCATLRRTANSEAPIMSREDLAGLSPYIDSSGGWLTSQLILNEVFVHLRDIRHIRGKSRVIVTDQRSVAMFGRRVSARLKKRRHLGKLNKKPPINLRDVLNKTTFVPAGEFEIIKIPEDLLLDTTFDFVSWITREIAEDMLDADEELFLNGEGAQEPWGVLNIPGIGGLQASGGGSAISPEDVRLLKLEMRAVRRGPAVWVVPRSFLKAVFAMREESAGIGTATGGFLWQPALMAGMPDMVAGKEVLESEYFPDNFATGSPGDPLALLADFGSYVIVENGGLQTRTLGELYAEENSIGVQFKRRMDAAPIEAEAFVTLKRGA